MRRIILIKLIMLLGFGFSSVAEEINLNSDNKEDRLMALNEKATKSSNKKDGLFSKVIKEVDKGNKLLEKGNRLLENGNRLIENGEALINKGGAIIDKMKKE